MGRGVVGGGRESRGTSRLRMMQHPTGRLHASRKLFPSSEEKSRRKELRWASRAPGFGYRHRECCSRRRRRRLRAHAQPRPHPRSRQTSRKMMGRPASSATAARGRASIRTRRAHRSRSGRDRKQQGLAQEQWLKVMLPTMEGLLRDLRIRTTRLPLRRAGCDGFLWSSLPST